MASSYSEQLDDNVLSSDLIEICTQELFAPSQDVNLESDEFDLIASQVLQSLVEFEAVHKDTETDRDFDSLV